MDAGLALYSCSLGDLTMYKDQPPPVVQCRRPIIHGIPGSVIDVFYRGVPQETTTVTRISMAFFWLLD
jgi:hypothetical protein